MCAICLMPRLTPRERKKAAYELGQMATTEEEVDHLQDVYFDADEAIRKEEIDKYYDEYAIGDNLFGYDDDEDEEEDLEP